MGHLNRYIAYSERDRKNGYIIVRYEGLAESEEHFKELVKKGMLDFRDYTIELYEKNVRKRKDEDYYAYVHDTFYGARISEW